MATPTPKDAAAVGSRATSYNVPRLTRKKGYLPWIVLVIGLVITFSAALAVKSNLEDIAKQDFVDDCDDVKTKITNRLDEYARVLRAGSAFFNASDLVTRNDWRIFTQTLLLEKQLPGIQGIGFSPVVRHKELTRHAHVYAGLSQGNACRNR